MFIGDRRVDRVHAREVFGGRAENGSLEREVVSLGEDVSTGNETEKHVKGEEGYP